MFCDLSCIVGEPWALLVGRGEGAKFKGRAVTVRDERPVGVRPVEVRVRERGD